MDKSIETMRNQLTSEQTAKFLILMEKFKSKEEFSVFNLWNIKKISKQDMADDLKRSLSDNVETDQQREKTLTNMNEDGVSVNQIQQAQDVQQSDDHANYNEHSNISKRAIPTKLQDIEEEDVDMALPNDEEDMHK